jgi:ankyrin repeat protein
MPLHVAARKGSLEMVRWLLRQRANRTLTSREGFDSLPVAGTAAEIARVAGHGEVADLIEGFDHRLGSGAWKVEMVALC